MVVKMIRMGHQLTDKLNNQLPLLTIQGMLQELEAQWLKCKMAKHWMEEQELCIIQPEDLTNKWEWWVNTLWVKTMLLSQLSQVQWPWNPTIWTSKDQWWDRHHHNPWWWVEAAAWRHRWCNKLLCPICRRLQNLRNGKDSMTIWRTRTDKTCW